MKTLYYAGAINDHTFGLTPFVQPTSIWLAMFSVAPTNAYTADVPDGTEFTASGYTRQEIAFAAAVDGVSVSQSVLSFGPAGEDWPLCLALGLFDDDVEGNLLMFDAVPSPFALPNTETLVTSLGELRVFEV